MSDQYTSQQTNKVVCNAFGCYNKAAKKIDVNAGSFGRITLRVCKKCISKFQEKEVLANDYR